MDMGRVASDTYSFCSDSVVLIPQACSIFSEVSLVSSHIVGPDEGLRSPPGS